MQLHARSLRFLDWSGTAQTWADHAGYKTPSDENNQVTEYWIVPAVFKGEICQGYEQGKVCNVLHGIGWLKRNTKQNRFTFKRYNHGWYYVLLDPAPPDFGD